MHWRLGIWLTGCAADRLSCRMARYERVLSRSNDSMQQLLTHHGYDVGEPDGQVGLKTRTAIRDFQAKMAGFQMVLHRQVCSISYSLVKDVIAATF
jgi:hypothetical protein